MTAIRRRISTPFSGVSGRRATVAEPEVGAMRGPERPHGRRLPGAVRPQEPEHLAVAHLEGDVPEGDAVTEALGQAVDGERRGCPHVVEHRAGALRCRHGQHPLSLPACYQPGLSASGNGRADRRAA